MKLGAAIIGNEVLSAKVADENGPHLIRRCRERGVPVSMVCVVPDDVDAIVETLGVLRARSDLVVTSGGVGPTHDDVTIRAIALALGRPVVREARIEAIIRSGPSPIPSQAFRMADVPEGAELVPNHLDPRFPVVRCCGVHALAGVPQIFKTQLEAVLGQLAPELLALRTMYLRMRESEIAFALDDVARGDPAVAIGSYLAVLSGLDYRVKLTIEHGEAARVDEVAARLRAALPADAVVREEFKTG